MNQPLSMSSVVFQPLQKRFLSIPQTPLCYWLRERFFDLLAGRILADAADVSTGLQTSDDPRFVRFTWEAPIGEWAWPVRTRRWVPFEKGGGYGKWFGHHFWVVDWECDGARIKTTPNPRVQNEQHYFKEGWTYPSLARGCFSLRWMRDSIWGAVLADAIIPKNNAFTIAVCLNSRFASANIRSFRSQIVLSSSYVGRLPLPEDIPASFSKIETACISLKRYLVEFDPTERSFSNPISPVAIPVIESSISALDTANAIAAILHTLEGISERMTFNAYCVSGDDLKAVLNETGTPAGWFPLIKGYDALPPLTPALSLNGEGGWEQLALSHNGEGEWEQGLLPDDVGHELLASLNREPPRTVSVKELSELKRRLRALYEAGPGAREEVDDTGGGASDDEEEENESVAVGASIPIPAETFLEELSQKLEVHPISVYWLLKEGVEKEGWRCRPEEQRLTKDRFTVMILRLLGHRWPRQIEAVEEVPDWADDNGIIPLTEGTDGTTLHQRIRERLAADYGDKRVSSEENTFEEVMGKPLSEWVRRDFFRHHISQFKKRPIAWHISSTRWTGHPRQEAAFECLLYYHRTDGDLLPKIRSQYVGPLMKRLDLELRGLENSTGGNLCSEQESRKVLLRDRIPEIKAFDGILSEIIATGFGPEVLRLQLRQYALNDAMLCLKARWLKKLSGLIQNGPLADWQKQADQTGLHADFSTWISDAMTHLDRHCVVVGPAPPEEQMLDADPTAKELAEMICAEAEAMMTDALKCACTAWWKSFDSQVLKPVSEKVRDAKKRLQSLKEQTLDPKHDFKEQSDIKRRMNDLKSDIKVWQNELALKTGQGKTLKDAIEAWPCPEALTWEPWLAGQDLYDQLSSLNARRSPPQTVQEFIRQEGLYHPDINDGVRVNIVPLQKAGLLAADVLAGKDVDKAIADRAAWRDDERRWCREGKLPKPGWWE